MPPTKSFLSQNKIHKLRSKLITQSPSFIHVTNYILSLHLCNHTSHGFSNISKP
ncbi:hypothetical protein Hanom_Chr05g00415101 [Helianthus anomalus]